MPRPTLKDDELFYLLLNGALIQIKELNAVIPDYGEGNSIVRITLYPKNGEPIFVHSAPEGMSLNTAYIDLAVLLTKSELTFPNNNIEKYIKNNGKS